MNQFIGVASIFSVIFPVMAFAGEYNISSENVADYSKHVSYMCENDTNIIVKYIGQGEEEFAILTTPDKKKSSLKIALSGSGTLYEGSDFNWHAKAEIGLFITDETVLKCIDRSDDTIAEK